MAGQCIGAVRERHRCGIPLGRFDLVGSCIGCNENWPCSAIRLADFVEKYLSRIVVEFAPPKPTGPPNTEVRKGGGMREKA